MSLLQMSVSGAIMILTVVVIRALALHKLPKKTFLALWGVVLVRLMVPYSVPSALSVYSLVGRFTPSAKEAQVLPVPPAVPVLPLESAAPGTPAFPPEAVAPALDPWTAVWLIGLLGCGIFFAVAYVKCRREFRASLPVGNEYAKRWLQAHPLRRLVTIRQSDRISAPLTYGVFRPVILMPKSTDWADEEALAYVLGHEAVHIRRFDAVTKLVLTAALCVHWFNPLVWIMFALANRDIELSCDEAVIRDFGERTKSAYAMTLIRMEEKRISLSPLCNHFSKNAIEERIVAIMKLKKTSLAALLMAMCLIAGVTTGFATSGQVATDTDETNPTDIGRTVVGDKPITIYTDPTSGKTYYSLDEGKTWTLMTDAELNDLSAWDDVAWWTAEEYAAWLEQEKIDLQTIIGAQGWTPSTGWFTWTQELVDETIAKYEQTLKDIQAGQKISKPTADGDTMIQLGYDPDAQTSDTVTLVAVGYAEKLKNISDHDVVVGYSNIPHEGAALMDAQSAKIIANTKWFPEYEQYGLSYDGQQGVLRYEGEVVNFFHDETSPGVYTHVSFCRGTVGVEVHRNADWQIVGLVKRSAPTDGAITQEGSPEQTAVTGGTTFFENKAHEPTCEELLAEYGKFGISFDACNNMLYQGKLVRWFADFVELEEGALATRYVYRNDEGTEYIHTVRDRIDNGDGSYDPFGPLTGIVPWKNGSLDDLGFLFHGHQINEATETSGGDCASGVTFAERFAKYKDFGITYEEAPNASGCGNVYLNGQLVSRFSDVCPDGSAFSFTSADHHGCISAQAVYNGNGQLVGVMPVKEGHH